MKPDLIVLDLIPCDFNNSVILDRLIFIFASIFALYLVNTLIRLLVLKCLINKKNDLREVNFNDDYYVHFLSKSVYLKNEKENFIIDMVNLFLGRWHDFKNINNLNTKILIQTIVITLNLSLVVLIFSIAIGFSKIQLSGLFSLVSFAAIFWHHHTVFYRKWKHCSDFLLKYHSLELDVPCVNYLISNQDEERQEDYDERFEVYSKAEQLISDSLFLDLLHLDLWAHKSFYRTFNNFIYNKLKEEHKDNYKSILIEIAKGKYTEKKIEALIRIEKSVTTEKNFYVTKQDLAT